MMIGNNRHNEITTPDFSATHLPEFQDHYIPHSNGHNSNNEIIRPKPRRLVDMRRVGVRHENLTLTPTTTYEKPTGRPLSPTPPSLPLKPLSNYHNKPPSAPPKLTMSPLPAPPVPPPPPGKYQGQQIQYHNSAAFMLNLNRLPQPRPYLNVQPQNCLLLTSQRSTPNIPQLLQQKRLFLSPPPEVGPNLGSYFRKSPSPPNVCHNRPSSPYYVEMSDDNRISSSGDWKSAENLQSRSHVRPPLPLPSTYVVQNFHTSGPELCLSPRKLGLDPMSSSKSLKSPVGVTRSWESDRIVATVSLSSPNYDQIRGPPNANSMEDPDEKPSIQGIEALFLPSKVDNRTDRDHLQELSHEDQPILAELHNRDALPISRKCRQQSNLKVKARRRNILQTLSMEDIVDLTGGHGNEEAQSELVGSGVTCHHNTGTGGSSSSEASSGHASMSSDSQASGSPPAPADYSKLTPAHLNATVPVGPTGYKSVLKSVPEDDLGSGGRIANSDSGNRSTDSGGCRSKSSPCGKSRHHRPKDPLEQNGSSGLEDIKQAIEQLTLRSYHSGSSGGQSLLSDPVSRSNQLKGHKTRTVGDHQSSYSTASTYSSMSGSECERHNRRPQPFLRHASLETINTQVTSADEFVWVDSHNRLVELQHFPWSNHDILSVIERSTRLRDNLERISMETIPRISYLLQRALVRIGREAQRLAKPIGFCTKQEISSAFRVVLSSSLADSCIKACLRASAMFSISTTEPLHRESKSIRAGLNLHVGKFQRWMSEVRLARFVHEFAAIHLTAGIENLIEDILCHGLTYVSTTSGDGNSASKSILTAIGLEQTIANVGDLWGLLQPFAHLNAGRTASGALDWPRWESTASMDSSESSTTIGGGNQTDDSPFRLHSCNKSLEQSVLTTCVGSLGELSEILGKVSQYHHKRSSGTSKPLNPITWSPLALQSLYYFMRCSQLEMGDEIQAQNFMSSSATLGENNGERTHHAENSRHPPSQELVYERPFIVLPPLIEWVRVASAHAEHRHSSLIDRDDVMQAARLLLPGIDCPIRLFGIDEFNWPCRPVDEFECSRRLKVDLAFKMLSSGRLNLIPQALLFLSPSKANTFNEAGLSPLILAVLRGDEPSVRLLLESHGADPNLETLPNGKGIVTANNEVQHWTALTFASILGHVSIVKILLERGASVEGGAKLNEEKSTQTPLQVAAAIGNIEILTILLNYGANPFLSSLVRDSMSYMGSASRGSFSAISVAASHGQRSVLHKLLSYPINTAPASKDVLSLEEMLAEGIPTRVSQNGRPLPSSGTARVLENPPPKLTKSQLKTLQESMYQSAETGHLEMALDLRSLGVPWTLHCWMNVLTLALETNRTDQLLIEHLLQDFLQILTHEDFSQIQFIDDCLPLLFQIFRNNKIKSEQIILYVAEILQICYGKMDRIKEIRDTTLLNGTRIDPKYVNNPELSDVQFRVEGQIFYAHKIVLVTSSPRFKAMLKSASSTENNPPVLQINDIRYHIFQLVMEYLYNGGCDTFRPPPDKEDTLELLAAAHFFQLDGLLRYCETRSSQMVTVESVVSLYFHAKIYNAVQLLEFCQGFILQNFVQALTSPTSFDSVRRLLFGKRLHNHDVLAGLLLTLQARLKCRNSVTTHAPSGQSTLALTHPFPPRNRHK